MKKLSDKTGSFLFESLISLSILSVVVITLIPLFILLFSTSTKTAVEVEGWRFLQDCVKTQQIDSRCEPAFNDGYQMEWEMDSLRQSVTMRRLNQVEVLYVEILP